MNKFMKDRNYLLKYCLKSLVILIMLNLGLYLTKGLHFDFAVSSAEAFLPLLGVLLCGLPSGLMHNCAHGNLTPKRLNSVVGEICGTIMLYGFRGFALAHMFHHKYPDNPAWDPHPPKGNSFLRFVVSPIKATLIVVERAYYQFHGESAESRTNIKVQLVLFNLGIAARIMFWVLLLGPKLFILAYLPVYAANIFVFAHINYATHVDLPDGSSKIINLNHNAYYRFVNAVSLGGYFHKSHHLRPGVFNPAKVSIDEARDLMTYIPGVRA